MKTSFAVKSLAAGLTALLAAGPSGAQVLAASSARAPLSGVSAAGALSAPALAPSALAAPALSASPLAAASVSAAPALAAPSAVAAAALPVAAAPALTAAPAASAPAARASLNAVATPAAQAPATSFAAKADADTRFDGASLRAPALVAVPAAADGPEARPTGPVVPLGANTRFSKGVTPELSGEVKAKAEVIERLRAEIGKVIVGQKEMVESIVMAMIASEHVFLEGMPGVAKTQAVKASADAVKGDFKRIQGTPDKLPSDIIGTEILQDDAEHPGMKIVVVKFGPVFTNILLVDEINRMPPKTQAALLEAMAEGQVTIGDKTYKLGKPFIVLATQNPIEQEGTYRLPEAQQDRFMFKVSVPRPSMDELLEIMDRFSSKDNQPKAGQVSSLQELDEIRKLSDKVYVDPSIKGYIANLIEATHNPSKYGIQLKEGTIEKDGGASPRAAIYLLKAARIHALLQGRAWVGPSDVEAVAHRILRHRIILGFTAPRDLTTDKVVDAILQRVSVPASPAAPAR